MQQERVPIDQIKEIVSAKTSLSTLLHQLSEVPEVGLKPSPKTATTKTTKFRTSYEKEQIYGEPDRIDLIST